MDATSEPKTAEVKVVPCEPTEAMIEAAGNAPFSDARKAATNILDRRTETVADMLRAGIAAASASPPAETGEGDWRKRYLEIEGIREQAEGQDRLARGTSDPISKSEHETQAAGLWERYDRELAKDAQPVSPSEGEAVRGTIFKALRRYKLTNMSEADDSGIGYPLVDLMSNDGTTIATGEAEMLVLADHISEALGKATTHPASDQSDTERMRALREGWAAEMFDAGHTVSQRSWTDANVTEEQRDNYRRAVDRKVEKVLAALAEKAADQCRCGHPACAQALQP